MDDEYFDLVIRSREGNVFEGKVRSITSYNEKGKFDILPQHANFISLLKEELHFVDENVKEHIIKIESALLRKKDLKVEVYLGVKTFTDVEVGTNNKDISTI